MRILNSVVMAIVFFGISFGCFAKDHDAFYPKSVNTFKGHDGESTFYRMYDSSLKLPVSKDYFIKFLKEKGLKFEIYSVRGDGFFPLPDLISGVKDSDFSLIYDVWDPSLLTKRRAVHFYAYVDNNGMVVYVENHFQYSESE